MEQLDKETRVNYPEQKCIAMNKEFDGSLGINSLVWEEKHNYLNDLHIQKKK